MSKVCTKCKIAKDETEFYSNKRMPDGLDYYCKSCRKNATHTQTNSYEVEDYRDTAKAFIESLKTECCKCGEDRPWVIQFHHINPLEKEFNISSAITRSRAAIWKEASKCVCLCSNCHDEFHHFFGNRPVDPIGSLDLYLNNTNY